MGITKFQDFLFAINDDADRRLTDEELSAAMHESILSGRSFRGLTSIWRRSAQYAGGTTRAPKATDRPSASRGRIGLRMVGACGVHIQSRT